jgi:hypothetical protein
MTKVVRLTEFSLINIIKKIINEDYGKESYHSFLINNGFIYVDEYSNEYFYDTDTGFHMLISPSKNSFKVFVCLGKVMKDKNEKTINTIFKKIETIIGIPSYKSMSGYLCIDSEKEINNETLHRVIVEFNKLKPFIGKKINKL